MPLITVVVPTIAGREEHYERCIAAYRRTLGDDLHLVTVRDLPTCGQAWNEGAQQARGDYLHLTCDDLEPRDGWWQPAIEAVRRGYLPAPRVVNAEGRLDSCGYHGVELPDKAIVQMSVVPFMSVEQWDKIGPTLDCHYFTDNYLSYRGAQAGWPTVVRRQYSFTHHWAQPGRGAGMTYGQRLEHDQAIYLAAIRQEHAAPVDHVAGLPVVVDLSASLQSLAANDHVHDGMLKLSADLDRYQRIIETTKPEVVVETGTWTGAMAQWFREQGPDVITVDVQPASPPGSGITCVTGDSTDPATARHVAELVAGRRCMVSLDSLHSALHVGREIDLYGPLVTPGCYLVVEDGIFGYAPDGLRAQHGLADMIGSPLDPIAEKLVDHPDWWRSLHIEGLSPVSHHPAGFWRRNEAVNP